MVEGYAGFLFMDKNGYSEVAVHWEHRFNHMVKRYNDIYRVQMLNITPHVCRHTYCSNMAKSGMNPKTLQYLMGYRDIGVTLNTYTHLGLGRCHGRAAADGGFGERQKGTGKEQGGEAHFSEDVPGDLNKESLCALLRWGVFFVYSLYHNTWFYDKICK